MLDGVALNAWNTQNTNLWRLSRLVKNYGVTIVESNDSNKIYFLSNYDDNDFAFAFEELKKENTKNVLSFSCFFNLKTLSYWPAFSFNISII